MIVKPSMERQPGDNNALEDGGLIFIDSTRGENGKRKLIYKGHAYIEQKPMKILPNVIRFECDRRKNLKCHGSLHVLGSNRIVGHTEHSHAPDVSRVNGLKVGINIFFC